MGKVKEKISGAASKISKRADVLGAVLGYGMTCDSVFKLWGSTNWLSDFATVHVNAVTRHNFTSVTEEFVPNMTTHAPLVPAASLMIAGFVGGMLPSIIPSQGPICSIAKKAGFGMLIGSALSSLVVALASGSSPFGTTTQSANRPAGAGQGSNYPTSSYNSIRLGGPGYPHSWSAPDGYKAVLRTESVMP